MTTAKNDFGNLHYDGPQPPPGHGVHHYHFRVFALDVPKLDVSNDGRDSTAALVQPNVKSNTWTPESMNSISKDLSAMGPGSRIN